MTYFIPGSYLSASLGLNETVFDLYNVVLASDVGKCTVHVIQFIEKES